MKLFIFALHLLQSHLITNVQSISRPNIIFMLSDDNGFNDVQFTSTDINSPSTDTLTPNLNSLAKEGIILSNYYVQSTCSPTRAAFITGRLPFRTNMLSPIQAEVALSLTRQVSILSEEFQLAGYATHAIGKWDLGFQSVEYTPTYRGFDTFYGFYNQEADYYTSNVKVVLEGETKYFHDLRRNLQPVDIDGTIPTDYSVYRFRDEAIKIINKHSQQDEMVPFFMYLAWQSSHEPSQTPDDYYDLYYDDKKTTKRAANQGQTTSMDDAVGMLIDTLKSTKLWDNTLIVFSSDNGADLSCGDNFPLRGCKRLSFEGGIRVPAFISGGYIDDSVRGSTFGNDNFYVHVTDWYPTLLEAAGIDISYAKSLKKVDINYTPEWETISYTVPLDGRSIWKQLHGQETDKDLTQRLLILDLVRYGHDYDTLNGTVRWGKWKYLKGLGQQYHIDDGNTGYLWGRDWANLDIENALGCDLNTVPTNLMCFYTEIGCLFDISVDPCEFTDLSETEPDIVSYLQGILQDVKKHLPSMQDQSTYTLTMDSEEKWIPSPDGFWGAWQEYKDVQFERTLYVDYNRMYGSDDSDEVEVVSVNFNNGLPLVNTVKSDDYFIVDINRDAVWLQYLSSTRYYHNDLLGPSRDDHVNWKEWILIDDLKSLIVSPDCTVCDESSILNSNYPFSSGYYMTPVAAGCTQLPIGRIACDMDYNTYECNVCSINGQEHKGYWSVQKVYNGLNDIEETFIFDEIEESSDWRYGLCGFTIRNATAAHTLSNKFSECKRSNHITSKTENILPKRKPSIGTNGKFCMCIQPSNLEDIDISIAIQPSTVDDNKQPLYTGNNKETIETIELYQSDFLYGTYRITKPGKYMIMEDITFDFNAPSPSKDDINYNNGWWPDAQINDVEYYDGIGKLRGPYFLGFFAGITIECDGVTLDLNGYTLAQSLEFYYQQSFFIIISLASQYFLPTQGPVPFGTNVKYATNTIIKNGKIGLSSHHGIFGHFNKNILIKNIEITQFKTHGLQLNGFDGIELENIKMYNNKYNHKLSPYYTHMRMLRKAHKLIAAEEIVQNECVTFYGRSKCVTMNDLVNDVDILLNIAFKYAVFDYDALSDNTLSDYNKQLWNNNKEFLISDYPQIGTVYGFFLNYIGANVIAWYTGSESTKSHNIKLSNISIYDLKHNGQEALAFHQGKDLDSDRNSQRILNMLNAPVNALHVFGKEQLEYISYCNNYEGYNSDPTKCDINNFKVYYVGNKIIDIQIMAYHLINKFDLSWNYCYGGAADLSDLTRFAIYNKPFWPYSPILVGSADAMIHVGKGIVGIRFNGVNNVELNNINIYNIHSYTKLGSNLAGEYINNGYEQGPYLIGYTMNRVRAISITMSKDIIINNNINIYNMISDTGLVWGFDVWFDVNIKINKNSNMKIYNLFAGNDISDKDILNYEIDTVPNFTPEVCAIKLYDDDNYPVNIIQDINVNIDMHCIVGYIGCDQIGEGNDPIYFTHYGSIDNTQCNNNYKLNDEQKWEMINPKYIGNDGDLLWNIYYGEFSNDKRFDDFRAKAIWDIKYIEPIINSHSVYEKYQHNFNKNQRYNIKIWLLSVMFVIFIYVSHKCWNWNKVNVKTEKNNEYTPLLSNY